MLASVLALLMAGAAACGAGRPGDRARLAHVGATRPAVAPARQLGIDVDFASYPGVRAASQAAAIVRYVKGLRANSISISFPFVTTGAGGTKVRASSATPTPGQLAAVVRDARQAGLYVTIRPLLDERNLGTWRSQFLPASRRSWFASYQRFLAPYLRMAQRAGVSDFCVGVEFGPRLGRRGWVALDRWASTIFTGTLSYSADWHFFVQGMLGGGPVTSHQVDAYPGFALGDKATIAQLTVGWDRWIAGFPRAAPPARTIFGEVGIAAQAGAYANSSWWGSSARRIIPDIQVRWYTAACDAVARYHVLGLYFGSIPFGRPLIMPAYTQDPGSFVAMPGATAIRRCFARLS